MTKKSLSIPSPFTEIRPVDQNDKWCRFAKPKDGVAPWGYVLVMPTPKGNFKLDCLSGYVIRTMEKQGQFFLQVYMTRYQLRQYGINYKELQFEQMNRQKKSKIDRKVRKKNRHIINMVNFKKRSTNFDL